MCAYAGRLNRSQALAWAFCGFAVTAPASEIDGDGVRVGADAQRPASDRAFAVRLQRFDIPAQPLAAALHRYASVSGWPILFHGTMVAGRTSSPLQGDYEPGAALHRLLDGTGLVPAKVDAGPADTYTLKAVDARQPNADPDAPGVDFAYGGWVQARIWQTLCADARTAPGRWRSLLRFRVDADGHVHAARMLSSTGTAARDGAVLAALQRVRMERTPPPEMPQPLTLLILPFTQGSGPRCAGTPAGTERGSASAHD